MRKLANESLILLASFILINFMKLFLNKKK